MAMRSTLTELVDSSDGSNNVTIIYTGDPAGAPGEDVLTTLAESIGQSLSNSSYRMSVNCTISVTISPVPTGYDPGAEGMTATKEDK